MFEKRSAESEAYDTLIRCTPSEASFLRLLRADAEAICPDAALAVGIGAARARRTLEAIEVKALARAGCRPRDPQIPDAVAHEYSAGTGMYPPSAVHRLEVARSVVARLPLTVKALEAAEITYRQLEQLDRATLELSAEQAGEVEAACLAGTARGFTRRLTAAIARIAPEAARKKTEQLRRSRAVLPWSDPVEGIAGLAVQGPLDQVAQLKAAIDMDARLRIAGECRRLEARRFDVLYDWARSRLGLPAATDPDRPTAPPDTTGPADTGTGTDDTAAAGTPGTPDAADRRRCGACGRSGPATIPINVTVSLDTLLHLSDQPGDLDGAPIPAEVARELAADGRWRRWVIEAATGRLLDIGAATYRPGADLDRFIRGRDRTCRFPSCTQPAIRCDLDHTAAFHTENGPTSQHNLVTLCRTHHRLKHDTAWTYHLEANGDVTWTAPTGRTYTDPAEDHYDDPILSQYLTQAHARERARHERAEKKPTPRPVADWNPPADGDEPTDLPW